MHLAPRLNVTMRTCRISALVSIVWLSAPQLIAAPILFESAAAWDAAVTRTGVATFEGMVSAGEREFNMQAATWREGLLEFTPAYPDLMEIVVATPAVPFDNPFTSDIINFQGWLPNPRLDVTLLQPSAAIGFEYWTPAWARDPSEPTGVTDLTAVLLGVNGTYMFSLTSPLAQMGFFGVTLDDSIYRVQLIAARGNGMSLDNFTTADRQSPPVPEPASLLPLPAASRNRRGDYCRATSPEASA
jgi:hypothetical protein